MKGVTKHMNKMFIIDSSESLFNEAASLVDSYVVNAVDGDQLGEAQSELGKLYKRVTTLLIGTFALIIIFKTVSSTIQKNKAIKDAENGKSKSKEPISDYDGINMMIQQLNSHAEQLKQVKAEVKSQQASIKKARADRAEILRNYAKNDKDIDTKMLNDILKKQKKETDKIIEHGNKTVSECEASYKAKQKYATTMVRACGDSAQNAKFDAIIKSFQNKEDYKK